MSHIVLPATPNTIFSKVVIVGLGLIGASLAQAIKDKGLAQQIAAVDRHQPSLDAALADGVISSGSQSLLEVIAGCDLIVMAVPVQAVRAIFEDILIALQSQLIASDCVISDVCSTKLSVFQAAKQVFGDELPSGLVPAHPIAGAENSGYYARRGDLFVNHNVIICPPSLPSEPNPSSRQASPFSQANQAAVNKVTALWQSVGAAVISMTAEHHDKVLAHTSHLPHLLAFNLVAQLADHDDNMDIFRYAAGGFRDFTRIAASDPIMWHDIFLANQDAIVEALDDYSDYLAKLRRLIIEQDSVAILGLLGRAQAARRHFGHMLSSTPYTQTSTVSTSYVITPSLRLSGTIAIPGDKSISHRSIMLGSLAEGVTKVSGFLEGEDALATLQAFRDMGVTIEGPNNGELTIYGVGMSGLKSSKTPLYMGNSGTSMRLLSGILAAQSFDSVLTGDVSLSKRPMERVAVPLRQMGAQIQSTGHQGTAPLSITGRAKAGGALKGVRYQLPVASAQIKSCLLLAGLWATGTTTIVEPKVSRDHTERLLEAFGYPVMVEGNQISVEGGGKLKACDIEVPGDISSAAFFMVATSIAPDSEVTLPKVGINPTRTGVIDILRMMG
ncbi:MAG: bifunctional prephenate dehydrogenase/3-phosphoshikimate 1-carboxyvinyltransferase, partial [Psychrobacter sp.]|nr:bifunctional prephenate dehydrogenase/3-phosphoshikimate 1-carboxyvinyltransferase [Psychrobacter sp.]